jgi:hypothetical protein
MNRRLVVIATGVVLTACGVAGGSELQQIDSADLAGLDQTTTSSTTTTTVGVPDTSVIVTTAATSTTIATEPVALYFVDGSSLQAVTIQLARSPSAQRVLAALEAGPQQFGDVGIGLRTLLPHNLVNSVVDSGEGYVTVDLAADAFAEINPADQRTAIAQIVLTLVGPNGRPGIGQVRFTLDGEPLRVPRRDNLQSEPGGLVSLSDYESLLQEIEPETTTTQPPIEPAVPPASPPL